MGTAIRIASKDLSTNVVTRLHFKFAGHTNGHNNFDKADLLLKPQAVKISRNASHNPRRVFRRFSLGPKPQWFLHVDLLHDFHCPQTM